MILPDVNLLVYAHNELSPFHARAKAWWKDLMTREVPVGMPWAVACGFVRVATHPDALVDPLPPLEALEYVGQWLERDHVTILEPGPRHLQILRDLFTATGVAGRLTTDTHLAAIAIEHRAEVHSNDRDFERFPGLRFVNPLS